MLYADTRCKYEEEYEPEHVYVYRGPCIVTGKINEVRIKDSELYAYRYGSRIQDAMKSLSDDERNFLMCGISAEGWKQMEGDGRE